MDGVPESRSGPKRTRRLIEQADQMVRSGRLSAEEATRLRAARSEDEAEQVVRAVRVRHAGARLDTAVAEGAMSRGEAEAFLDRLRSGEHSQSLRSHLARFRLRGGKGDGSSRSPGQDEASHPYHRPGQGEAGDR